MNRKVCSKCNETKPLTEFYKDKNCKDGYTGICKACKLIKKRSKMSLIHRIYNRQKRSSIERGHVPPAYTKDEFITWFWEQPNFEQLYNDWVTSDYDKMLVPSPDRLKNHLPYTLDNLRLVTWQVNNDAEQKPVIVTNAKTDKSERFKSIRQAKYFLGYKSSTQIASAIKSGKIVRGFKFEYDEK